MVITDSHHFLIRLQWEHQNRLYEPSKVLCQQSGRTKIGINVKRSDIKCPLSFALERGSTRMYNLWLFFNARDMRAKISRHIFVKRADVPTISARCFTLREKSIRRVPCLRSKGRNFRKFPASQSPRELSHKPVIPFYSSGPRAGATRASAALEFFSFFFFFFLVTRYPAGRSTEFSSEF